MFESLSDRLQTALSGLRGKGKLTEADINATAREIRLALLEADVSLTVVRAFIKRIKERAAGAEVSEALNPAQQVIKIVNEELVDILGGETRRLQFAKNPPTVIMLAGLQGAGKTTLAGKLAKYLSKQGHTPMLVACDLQRPGAVQQLQIVGERAEVAVFAPDPGTSIDSHEHEMGTSHGDPVTGVVLTKLDGDARGGAALSIREVTGKPIMFASTGEKLQDFDVFHPERMASRILGMGDLLSLIEQAEATLDHQKAEEAAAKLGSGELTLNDFLDQMLMIRRMGPIGNLLKMMPGGKQMNQMAEMVDEKQLDRIQAIIRGMTPQERENPKILNASRRKRIANGSGVSVSEVNQLIERFNEAKKMMSKMAGQFGMGPGMGRSATKKKAKGRKGKNGKRKPAKNRPRGGMLGMPGMPGGMPSMEELQKLQSQMGGGGMPGMPGMPKMPKGMENIDLNNLDFGQGKK